MHLLLRLFLLSVVMLFWAESVMGQVNQWRDIHKVKKKETIFGIAREYSISVEELKQANPEMQKADYNLKKGDYVFIPFPKATQAAPQPVKTAAPAEDITKRAIRLGVMLPLHQVNGDGKRMTEYYRGVLMACDSLKKQGISIDVYAWNLAEDADVKSILADANAARCDLIIGPLYSKFVSQLSTFVAEHGIKLVIPFSIHCMELLTNPNIFQVYQSQNAQNEATVRRFCEWFKDAHTIVVDCADPNSTKGHFTAALRQKMDSQQTAYSLTSLSNSDEQFAKAFSTSKCNVVVLNSARQTDLNAAFGKLSSLVSAHPEVQVSMFGYTEWLMYAGKQLENFYKYDVYVPTTFYTNLLSTDSELLQQRYRQQFHSDMLPSLPKFAFTGFDHAFFFIKGLHKYGKAFDGAAGRFGYPPVQTPLKFTKAAEQGGYQNRSHLFVHYRPEHRIETITY